MAADRHVQITISDDGPGFPPRAREHLFQAFQGSTRRGGTGLGLAIASLKEQERTVVALNFFEELKLHEIATVLGLSVCRISQIRTAALGKLRDALSGLRAA